MLRGFAKVVGGGLVILLVGAGCGYLWASNTAEARLAQNFETHRADFAIPPALTEAELTAMRAERSAALPPPVEGVEPVDPLSGVDLAAEAGSRAVARGKHLVESRYVCIECHGADFGGGTMIDDPVIGTLLGPNLTSGKGSRTEDFQASDWDRAVRHGVLHDGTPALMPSKDFFRMSDQELGDIVAYIRSVPPVDKEVAAPTLGPVGTFLTATGAIELSAELLEDHAAAHPPMPPEAAVSAEFGQHLAQVCTGCHRADLSGGPITGGDPSWGPAGNLTPHEQGLKGWDFATFDTVMRTGARADGTKLVEPMALVTKYTEKMSEVEMQAMWAYLQTVEARPDGT